MRVIVSRLRHRTSLALLPLSIGLGASAADGGARAGASPAAPDAVARLQQAGTVACEPLLPVFCGNIHVSCAGPSTIKSFPFKLRATGARGTVESGVDTADVAAPYAAARVEWGDAAAYVIFWPAQGGGYVKLLADGSYSFRHYGSSGALMSRGECR